MQTKCIATLRCIFHWVSALYHLSCSVCSSKLNTPVNTPEKINFRTSHYYNSTEKDDSSIIPRTTKTPGNKKVCSYDTNILLMILIFYLGKSGTATASIAGALGFLKPCALVSTIHYYADTVGAAIREAVKNIEENNLRVEILATYNNNKYCQNYDKSLILPNGKLSIIVPETGLHTSYGMGVAET